MRYTVGLVGSNGVLKAREVPACILLLWCLVKSYGYILSSTPIWRVIEEVRGYPLNLGRLPGGLSPPFKITRKLRYALF